MFLISSFGLQLQLLKNGKMNNYLFNRFKTFLRRQMTREFLRDHSFEITDISINDNWD